MTKRYDKWYDMILETYDLLYKASVPSVSFYDLMQTCCRYEDADHNLIELDQPLTEEERQDRQYKIAIDYYAYFITEEKFQEIIESQEKKYKLNRSDRNAFHLQMFLGCGPTSALNRWLEKHPEHTMESALKMIRMTYPNYITDKERLENIERQYC